MVRRLLTSRILPMFRSIRNICFTVSEVFVSQYPEYYLSGDAHVHTARRSRGWDLNGT